MQATSEAKEIKDIGVWAKMPDVQKELKARHIDVARFLDHVENVAKWEKSLGNIYSDVFAKSYTDTTIPLNDIDPSILYVGRRLDVDAFGRELHQELSRLRISGYTMKVRERGQDVYTLFWNWARKPQDPVELGWKPNVKMHIASVSKLITAMAVVKLLSESGISVDSPVAPYMPVHFRIGPGVNAITFRHLLTQKSGFRDNQNGGPNGGYTLQHLKDHYQLGVMPANAGRYGYYNGNFVCLRIAMATIMGALPVSYNPFGGLWWLNQDNSLTDLIWDAITISVYENYVAEKIFGPPGIVGSSTGTASDSLAYSSRASEKGAPLDSRGGAGTTGWWLSVDEILSVMETFRSTSNIVSRSVSRNAIDSGFGLEPFDEWQKDLWGRPDCMTKSGYWSDANFDGRTQQCTVAYAPPNYTIAVFVNSSILPPVTPGVPDRAKISYTTDGIVRSLLSKHIR